MSFTVMASSNSLTVKKWEMETYLQVLRSTVMGHLMRREAIFVPEELKGGTTGDSTTFAYASKLTKVPVSAGGTLDGNEESLDLNSHAMVMNTSRIGVLNPNSDTIEQKRTKVNFPETSKKQLQRRAAELVDTSVMYQLAGVAPTSLTLDGTTYSNATDLLHVQGHNTIVAPTTNRVVWAGGRANDDSLTSADKFTLDLIDYALEASSLTLQPLEMLDGEEFDLFISPEQGVDLMHDAIGKNQWLAIQLAGKIANDRNNALDNRFKSKLVCFGRYRNVNIYESPRVAFGVNHSSLAIITTVRRAVMVGRDALSFQSPFGSKLSDDNVPLKFFSQLKDYDYYKGMEARLIYGAKKMSPANKDDIGVTVIATYAATHSITAQ